MGNQYKWLVCAAIVAIPSTAGSPHAADDVGQRPNVAIVDPADIPTSGQIK